MTTLREAAQFALDALHCPGDSELMDRVEQKLRAALEEQPAEQKPVAHENSNGVVHAAGYPWSDKEVLRPLVYGDTSQKPAKREPLTDEQKAVLRECLYQAMKWAAQGRIPECGAFGGIAQDLDWLCNQLSAHGIGGQV